MREITIIERFVDRETGVVTSEPPQKLKDRFESAIISDIKRNAIISTSSPDEPVTIIINGVCIPIR